MLLHGADDLFFLFSSLGFTLGLLALGGVDFSSCALFLLPLLTTSFSNDGTLSSSLESSDLRMLFNSLGPRFLDIRV